MTAYDKWYRAAMEGDLSKLRDIPKLDKSRTAHTAARCGHVHVLGWLHECGHQFDARTFREAASGGQLQTMEWLLEKHCPFDETAFQGAAQHGSCEALQWLLDHGCPVEGWFAAALMAARYGREDAFCWVRGQGLHEDCMQFLADEAARYGHLDFLKTLFILEELDAARTARTAAGHGHLEVAAWLLARNPARKPGILERLFRKGYARIEQA